MLDISRDISSQVRKTDWTEDILNTPRPRHRLDMKSKYNSSMIEWEGLKSFT